MFRTRKRLRAMDRSFHKQMQQLILSGKVDSAMVSIIGILSFCLVVSQVATRLDLWK
jgi:predicted solute-binding protein